MQMSIGKVAQKCGVTAHTLRYYEKIGLLPEVAKNASGQRVYSQTIIDQILFIKRAQRLQFSLDEIRKLLGADITASKNGAIPKPEIQALVSEKLVDIDERLLDLKLIKTKLQSLLNDCLSSDQADPCPILEDIKGEDCAKSSV